MSDAIPSILSLFPQSAQELRDLLDTRVPIVERDGPMDTPCFVWQGCVDAQGYPDRGRRKHDRAHRQVWELVYGRRDPGSVVHHRCENTLCLNPLHLELVTRKAHLMIHRPWESPKPRLLGPRGEDGRFIRHADRTGRSLDTLGAECA